MGSWACVGAAWGAERVVELVQRFEGGGFLSRDVRAWVVAGLRGGGWQGSAKDLVSAEIEGGVVRAAEAAAELLARAFAAP